MPKPRVQSRFIKSPAPIRARAPVPVRTTDPPASQPCRTSLLDLPEDIIRLVFDFLPLLPDKVLLACVAPKFRLAFEGWARTRRNSLEAYRLEMMPLPEMIRFFKVAGPFIKELLVDCSFFQKESLLVEFISEYCPNLEEINYINATDEFHYSTIMSKMTHLKRVTIECLDAEDVLSFNLQSNQDLESFELVNGCYSGKNLCGFPNLKTLVLRDCLLWNSMDFGIPLKTLKSLDLDDCCFEVMNQSLYQKIADSCTELVELFFSGCDTNFEVIAQLPNLQKCTLRTWMTSNELNIGFLNVLAENKGNKLTHLHLSGQFQITNEHARCLGRLCSLKDLRFSNNDVLEDDHFKFFNDLNQLERLGLTCCGRVLDFGLMRMLRKYSQLNTFDLNGCDEITEDFVINAIRCCSKGINRSIVINVKGTKIRPSILTHPDYLDPLNQVKVNFIS
ncbi:SCF E3 ubiquitin ligase complex F-box protein pof2 [Drosophila elegans]|uniref:SCF E3 ubiquitin ligase complex F-box protein pof2 n=1 Tax=Drosophila elegans TaxID=30023 RepID=UPI0007E7CD6E|nr:SCF E3 ubiquitin ligase complex F-box protein pof2 [Drosophila elegans]